MSNMLTITLVNILIIITTCAAITNEGDGSTLLWPKPQIEMSGNEMYTFDTTFSIKSVGVNSDILDRAIQRYMKIAFINPSTKKIVMDSGGIVSMDVDVLTSVDRLSLDMNENYTLSVTAPVIKLVADTQWGALRGLETFSQLVTLAETSSSTAHFEIAQTSITDFPRFHHRGLMIDTSRHWLPLSIIYQQLDAMAYGKFNVLHWHIVDMQSFPFVSKSFPILSQFGAYDSNHLYEPQDVQNVIVYARDRGIRVIVEFDTPGHTYPSWGGVAGILTQCYSKGKPTSVGPLNPISDTLWPFLSKFFAEVSEVFPDDYLHLGGDEVPFSCWQSNPQIQAYMKSKNWTDYALFEQLYETKLLDLIGSLNKSYIVWQEVFDNGLKLKPDTVINVWKGHWQNETLNVTRAGFRALISSPWYLNYISYGEDWVKYYDVEPTDFNGTDVEKDLVQGGEVCLWGEYIDATNSVSRTWPRANAVGERLWSSSHVTNLTDASTRMHINRCRLLTRGIAAEPPNGPSYCRYEWIKPYTPPF